MQHTIEICIHCLKLRLLEVVFQKLLEGKFEESFWVSGILYLDFLNNHRYLSTLLPRKKNVMGLPSLSTLPFFLIEHTRRCYEETDLI